MNRWGIINGGLFRTIRLDNFKFSELNNGRTIEQYLRFHLNGPFGTGSVTLSHWPIKHIA